MLKRKNIDIKEDTFKLLGFLAVSEGMNLKAYIEKRLDEIAAEVRQDALLLQLSQSEEANTPAIKEESDEAWAILHNAATLCK